MDPQTDRSARVREGVLDAVPYAACLLGRDGRVQVANPAACTLLGWPTGIVPDGVALWSLISAQQESRVVERLRHCLADGLVCTGEALIETGNGSDRWVDVVLTPWQDGTCMLALLRDVTARRTAQDALALGPISDRMVLDRIPAGIVVHDASTAISYANAKATELLGITYDTALGALVTDPQWIFLADDHRPMAIADFPVSQALTRKTITRDIVVGIVRPDRSDVCWVLCTAYPMLDANRQVAEVIVSFTEITERKRAEEDLRVSQERLDLVMRGSRDAPWDWTVETDLAYYSPRWLEMVGLGAEEATTDAALWMRLMHPDDRPVVEQLFRDLLRGPRTTYEIEFRLMHRQGHEVWVLSRGFILRDETGRAVRVSGANTDITERRQLEERLQQSQKMEAIGQLAGGIAHDFNNILAVVLGNLELLQPAVAAGSQAAAGLQDALEATHRGADLTRRLLAFSRQQVLSPRVIDVRAVVENLLHVVQRLIGETIVVDTSLPESLPAVYADPSFLENALLNLAINARDAMPSGGALTFSVARGRVRPGREESAAGLQPGDYLRIDVSDTGVGMPPDVAARAFEPFFTTKPVGAGTGLGLSMVYGFAKQSGGTLAIASSPGIGTTVTMTLPVARVAAEPLRPRRSSAVVAGGARDEVVLLVEDDAAVRRLCLRGLSALGYGVVEAESGPRALELLPTLPRVDLLLTDIVMPNGMSGRDLAEAVRRRYPALPVLFMSGYPAHMLDREDGRPSFRLLRKPFAFEELAEAMRDVLAQARGEVR